MPTARDCRWVLLLENGEYSGFGRYREPDEADVMAAECALIQAGRSGWLAVMSHSAYGATIPDILMFRPLCNPKIPFVEAVEAFRKRLNSDEASEEEPSD